MMNGFCSNCRRVWTLETEQGVCRWCGKLATCQTTRTTALPSFKSSRRGRRRQAEPYGNGYGELEGKYLTYYKVASRFNQKAKAQDRGDLLHEIILNLALAERNNGHNPFTEAAMCRIASHTVADYWYSYYRDNHGLDCRHCSRSQRDKCREDDLYHDCPKALRLESLNAAIVDSEGKLTELGELIADDRAIDLDAWLDAKTFLQGCPQRLIEIALKLNKGKGLTPYDRLYLCRFRKREQKSLFQMITI
jgi:hypothetical protein